MFVQVIQGRAVNPDGIRSEMERWKAELGPGAEGWLGGTSGVTDDGRFIALARFTSEEAARRRERERPMDSDPEMAEAFSLMRDLRYFDLRDPWLESPR